MAKETYVARCYNWEVNETIALYESFGWELVANNVVTSLNTTDTNVAAENDLTFSREKDAPWYAEADRLQREYVAYTNQIDQLLETSPEKESKFHWILFIIGLFVYGLGVWYAIGHIIVVSVRKRNVKKWHEENDPKIEEINEKKAKIANECYDLINGAK